MVVRRYRDLDHRVASARLAGVVLGAEIPPISGIKAPAGTYQLLVAQTNRQDQTRIEFAIPASGVLGEYPRRRDRNAGWRLLHPRFSR